MSRPVDENGYLFDDDCDCEELDTETIIARWSMDGAKTLSEAAEKLRIYADNLINLEKEGWQLVQEINDDHGYIAKKVSE